ncbi:EpsG family protein [Flavobacterium sp. F52]|uniref:EpsG family protein n=1 Tax=Flavobacterium sp. F52 TaxID=1202532 RepID=UPI000272FA59|nr:EpsG family protein [Flavobacterium sp. F52]EJG01882.1 hypothetical protein FF52_07739 [Flavobacterium sp. F52]
MIKSLRFFSLELPYLFRIFIFSPLLFFINFPFEYNADYGNYFPNYAYSYFTYEPLYEWYSYFCREFLGWDFFLFWFSISILELIFFALIYKTLIQVVLAVPSIIGMSQFFYGTQVRYALAALLIAYCSITVSRPVFRFFAIVVASSFHYGGVLIGAISLIAGKIPDSFFIINRIKPFLVLFFLLIFSFLAFQQFEYLVSFTRFEYYVGGGEFVEPISLVSLLYIICTVSLLIILFTFSKANRTRFIKIGIITLLVSLFTSPIAALSGRVTLFYFVIEPVLLGSLAVIPGGRFFKVALLLLYFVRVFFYFYVNDYYFYW